MTEKSAELIQEFIEPESEVSASQRRYYQSKQFFYTILLIKQTIDEVERRLCQDPNAIRKMKSGIREIYDKQSFMESVRGSQ